MSMGNNNSYFSANKEVNEDEVDLTRRAIIVGGVGPLAGGLFGCGAPATEPAGNPEICVDESDRLSCGMSKF